MPTYRTRIVLPVQSPSPIAGRLWIVLASLLWSLSGVFAKAPLFADWPAEYRGVLLAFWRALFAAMVLATVVRRPRWRPGLLPLVVSFAVMNGIYLTAMSLTTAANAIWLQSTCPFWVLLVSVLFLRQAVPRRELIPLAFAAVGVGVILAMELRAATGPGAILGLASGFFYGLVVICLWYLRDEDSAWLMAASLAASALVLTPWAVGLGVLPTAGQLTVLAAFGIVQMAIPYLCLARALRSISSQEAVAIGLIEPVLMPVWVWLAWGELPAWWTLAGAGLILFGLVLRYLVVERWGRGELETCKVHSS